MALSSEMRRLENKWNTRGDGSGWPKFLEWIEINGIRGWGGQRVDFPFPIVAIVGENGSGKSTILQSAPSVYKSPELTKNFASHYFPDTVWDELKNINILYSYQEGKNHSIKSIRKPTDRWRGNPARPTRHINYIDLSRIQPVSSRVGYRRLANPKLEETETTDFGGVTLSRLSEIVGIKYEVAQMALTSADPKRKVTVLQKEGIKYSGFHQGAGELTIMELLQFEPKSNSIILIDEIETSLHPRAQRRLIRDLAEKCRQLDLQIILTTHSPYILEELPLNGRLYILDGEEKTIVRGVSPEFAMTKMDEEIHPECEVYVEDNRAAAILKEILFKYNKEAVLRCRFIPYGAASVGIALGQMSQGNRFPRPSCVFLDGDQEPRPGCYVLPGEDAPEIVIFNGLSVNEWKGVSERIGRSHTDVVDACKRAMTYGNHKEWVRQVAERLVLGSDSLWEALCSCWVNISLEESEARKTIRSIEDCLSGPIQVSPSERGQLF